MHQMIVLVCVLPLSRSEAFLTMHIRATDKARVYSPSHRRRTSQMIRESSLTHEEKKRETRRDDRRSMIGCEDGSDRKSLIAV